MIAKQHAQVFDLLEGSHLEAIKVEAKRKTRQLKTRHRWSFGPGKGMVSVQFDPSRSFFLTLQGHCGKNVANQGP